MCPVGGTESVVDIAVGVGGELLDELFLAFLDGLLSGGLLLIGSVLGQSSGLAFLLSVETEVLKHQHLTRFQGSGLLVSLLAVLSELDGDSELFGDMSEDMFE